MHPGERKINKTSNGGKLLNKDEDRVLQEGGRTKRVKIGVYGQAENVRIGDF